MGGSLSAWNLFIVCLGPVRRQVQRLASVEPAAHSRQAREAALAGGGTDRGADSAYSSRRGARKDGAAPSASSGGAGGTAAFSTAAAPDRANGSDPATGGATSAPQGALALIRQASQRAAEGLRRALSQGEPPPAAGGSRGSSDVETGAHRIGGRVAPEPQPSQPEA